MPTIIQTLIPTAQRDYVAVFTQNFQQIFPGARILKATIKQTSKIMEHPAETGIILSDHRIVLPVEIELSLFLQAADYAQAYKSIYQYYTNATLIVVQTRTATYKNQVIQEMPHVEDPDQYDGVSLALKLKQILFAAASFGIVPKAASNTSTVDRGTQQGMPVPSSYLSNIAPHPYVRGGI